MGRRGLSAQGRTGGIRRLKLNALRRIPQIGGQHPLREHPDGIVHRPQLPVQGPALDPKRGQSIRISHDDLRSRRRVRQRRRRRELSPYPHNSEPVELGLPGPQAVHDAPIVGQLPPARCVSLRPVPEGGLSILVDDPLLATGEDVGEHAQAHQEAGFGLGHHPPWMQICTHVIRPLDE